MYHTPLVCWDQCKKNGIEKTGHAYGGKWPPHAEHNISMHTNIARTFPKLRIPSKLDVLKKDVPICADLS